MSSLPAVPSNIGPIVKGVPYKESLGEQAVRQLAKNTEWAWPHFPKEEFIREGVEGIQTRELMDRARFLATLWRAYLPQTYPEAVAILLRSLPPARSDTSDLGDAMPFFLPYGCFIGQYGVGEDDLELSIYALREYTMRSSAEFAIRPYFKAFEGRMLEVMQEWVNDDNPHVRRLCSEGSRPLLPWGMRLPELLADPQKTLPILEALKNDEELYVRRSVANHLGDLAKKHPEWVFELCGKWLADGASQELKWVIRHAVRYWAKRERKEALALRLRAKAERS